MKASKLFLKSLLKSVAVLSSKLSSQSNTSADATNATTTNSQALLHRIHLVLSCLWKVIQISGLDFLQGEEIPCVTYDVAMHTNHSYLSPVWGNNWHSSIFITCLQPLQILCQFIYTPNTLSATCSSTWHNLNQTGALARIPTPPHKNAAVPAGQEKPLYSRAFPSTAG